MHSGIRTDIKPHNIFYDFAKVIMMGGDTCVGKPSGSVLIFTLSLNLMYCLLGSCTSQTLSQCGGRKDLVQMTVMSFKPQNSESTDDPLPHYECYLGAEDADATLSSSKPSNTRSFMEPQPSPPARLMDTNLPPNTAVYTVTLDTDNDNAFGVFTCDAFKEGKQSTTIFTIFLRSDDKLFTKTVSAGDTDVTIDMTVPDPAGLPIRSGGTIDIRWRINRSNTIANPGGGGAYVSEDYELLRNQPISVNDEGVYEAHGFGLRNARQALQRLIVRSCAAGKWGPPGCNGICDNCYNGGVCDDESGRCICPPGFMGANCLTACGANKFGYLCEFQCDYGGSSDCIGRLFCLLDPYGCTCNTGYKDLNCTTECEPTKYGASCLQQCHCDDGNGGCDSFTGVCDSGTCQSGWSGTNCQIPDECLHGYFGSDCIHKCLCLDSEPCDKNTGACSNGQCASGSMRGADGARCQECPDGFYGDCSEECHCASDACDKATGECVGCCKPQWLETDRDTCQMGLERSIFSEVNSGQSASIRCEASQATIYSIYLSRERNSLIESGITRGTRVTEMNNQGSLISRIDFTINNASSTDVFYCLLVDSLMEPVAWLNTTFSAYELPVLNDLPTSPSQTNDSVTIRWRAWDADMDVGDPPVVSYITYYKEMEADRWTKGSNVSFDAPLEFTASGLKTDVNYTFSVAVVREGDGGEGPRSSSLTVKTLCAAPAAPINVQASLTDDNKIEVSWQIPLGTVCSAGIISFTIYVQIEGSNEEPVMVITVGGDKTSHIISENLEAGKNYVFQVSLTTDQESAFSLRSGGVMYPGPPDIGPSDPEPSGPNPVIFIVIAIIIVLIVIISIFVVVKRNFLGTRSQDKSDTNRVDSVVYTNAGAVDEPGGYSTFQLDSKEGPKPYPHCLHQGQSGEIIMSEYEETGLDKDKGKFRGSQYESVASNKPERYTLPPPLAPCSNSKVQSEEHNYEEPSDFENYTGVYINIPKKNKLSTPKPIKVSEFQSFMKKDKTVLVEGIVKEFMVLLKGKQYSCSVAEQHHLQKNKSQEILPYDHTRIVLTRFGNNESDYYNASYIKDHRGKISFIAAQGPGSKDKISNFWRMIWQEKVKNIVTVADSNQNQSKVYWPVKVKTTETYGEITVLGMESTSYSTYTIRKLNLLQNDNDDDKIHTVHQIQLHMWPFRGVPEDISSLIAIIKKVKILQSGGAAGPLLVHCSNGSGATGTFIAIYSLMNVLKESKTISVFDFVNNMRIDRMDMVQTRTQYFFIYEALQYAQLLPEDLSVARTQLKNFSDS